MSTFVCVTMCIYWTKDNGRWIKTKYAFLSNILRYRL